MPSILTRLRSGGGVVSDRGALDSRPVPSFAGWAQSSPSHVSAAGFVQAVEVIHRRSPVVAAAVAARSALVSEARFVWQSEVTGERFGTAALGVLERPAGSTRPRLLAALERDVCYAGSAFVHRGPDGGLRRVRPDLVDVVIDAEADAAGTDPWAEVVGFRVWPSGRRAGAGWVDVGRSDMAVWSPEPDPLHPVLGESWVWSVLAEVAADQAANSYVTGFLSSAGMMSGVATLPDGMTAEQFREWRASFEEAHAGAARGGKTLYLSAGTRYEALASKLDDLDLKGLQGGIEARIASRSRVPGTMLGTREGYSGSALNAGNYGATRRMWADGWLAPHLSSLCAALEPLLARPESSELVTDRDRMLFLQEDSADAAAILQQHAATVETLVRSGFTPDAAVDAVKRGRVDGLVGEHSGLMSVQLVPPEENGGASDGG